MFIPQEELQYATEEYLDELRHEYGLDKPLIMQYFDWISGVVRGDFGISIVQKIPVLQLISQRVPISFHLGILAFIISLVIGVPAGILCAIRRGTWIDTLVTSLANIGTCIPVFWLGILLVFLFGVNLGWLPTFGYTSPFTDFWKSTRQSILPVICLAIPPIASNARLARSSMLEVMRQDYIRTAWSKGLSEQVVIFRHALKNGLVPIVTLVGMGVVHIIGGSVLIETVFNIPGMGRLMVTGVLTHDYPVIQDTVFIFTILVMLANLFVDISYGWLDPRVKYS